MININLSDFESFYHNMLIYIDPKFKIVVVL